MIREPAVAGTFYPGTANALSSMLQALLDETRPQKGPAPKALIVPHAGYSYSGAIAATAYASLLPYRDRYKRVVLMGPCHRIAVQGLAASGAASFRTPLGAIALDHEAIAALNSPDVRVFDATHEFEHSLEVQLPFLQTVIRSFKLVPLVVGNAAPESVAAVLDILWGGPETLIVISSDLSHYLTYDQARAFDRATCQAIENLAADNIDHDHACGATPIAGLLISAKRRGMQVTTLDLRNSGDTAGDKRHVVGYGAWRFLEI